MTSEKPEPPPKTEDRLALIRAEYVKSDSPWIVGFSGGKDSSAVLRLLFGALESMNRPNKPITIVYCDTGVEIPVVSGVVSETLEGVEREAQYSGLPISVRVATPALKDRFFVKVIGRGYPPPTNKFRWCTDRLRINPVQRVVKSLASEDSVILLGVRRGESASRDQTISRHEAERPFYLQQAGHRATAVFAPVLDYTLTEIWETVMFMPKPSALDGRRLWNLYGEAAAEECPLIREPVGSPCSSGRFGCWTCTVVGKDKSSAGLVEAGYDFLQPLLDYRDWLQVMRDDPVNRCPRRRNGTTGPGPLTLAARKRALTRLRRAEEHSGLSLLDTDELEFIEQLWLQDQMSAEYKRIERGWV